MERASSRPVPARPWCRCASKARGAATSAGSRESTRASSSRAFTSPSSRAARSRCRSCRAQSCADAAPESSCAASCWTCWSRRAPERTLFQAFLDARETFGAGYPLVQDIRMEEETYGSLLRMALALARLLKPLTREGDTVGVLTPNAAPTLGLILALSATKRVPAMLNYTAGADGLEAACVAARIRVVVASRAFVEKARLAPALAPLSGVEIHYLEDLKSHFGWTDKLWVLWHQFFPQSMCVPQSPEEPAIVLFTSGSEGKPKGVVHTHASILSNVAQIRALADFTPLDRFMLALPVFHSFGLTCGAILPLVSGCKVFLYPSPLHYRIIPELVYDRNCTVLFGTSTFLGNYAKHAHPYDFGRLRYVVAGAEKLSDEVRNLWIEKFGIRVLEGYGVTECAPVVAVNVPMACRIGSVGKFVPGLEYRIEPVPGIDAGGVLRVRGPNVMKGYLLYANPGVIDSSSLRDGWYDTGDIVVIDDEDFVHIRGRVKRFAKIAGEMVSLEVVEQIAAKAAPGFAHAASTRPDAAKGEAIVLFTTSPSLDPRSVERRRQDHGDLRTRRAARHRLAGRNTAARHRQDRLRAPQRAWPRAKSPRRPRPTGSHALIEPD